MDKLQHSPLTYASISGTLWVHADTMRESLKLVRDKLPEEFTYLIGRIEDDIKRTEFLAGTFEEYYAVVNTRLNAQQYPHDRVLANGDTKDGNTGEIIESTTGFENNVNEPSKF
jgi:hypothetical protein